MIYSRFAAKPDTRLSALFLRSADPDTSFFCDLGAFHLRQAYYATGFAAIQI
jgi:hypothetical protein